MTAPTKRELTAAETPQIFGGEAAEKPDDEGMLTDEDIQSILRAEIDSARVFIDEEVGPDRAYATARYKAEPYGSEEQGRSQVVMTDVRDSVLATMPSLMRIFCGTEKAVEFCPRRAEAIDEAEQRTDVVNYVISEQNKGFMILHGAFKDALIRKTGIIKWWWDERTMARTDVYEGLLQDQITALADQDDITDIAVEKTGEIDDPTADDELPAEQDPSMEGATEPGKVPVHKVTVHRSRTEGVARFALLPGEEFLIDRDATCLDDAKIIGHRTYTTRSDLLALGYTADFLEEHGGTSFKFQNNVEFTGRRPTVTTRGRNENNPALETTMYTEVWMRLARDPKKPATLVKICAIGDDYFLGKPPEDADEIPCAVFSIDPEPHEFFGTSMADLTMDLQKIDTNVMRSTLDSLSLALHPRMEVNANTTNLEDAMNTEIGALIRVTQPGSVREIATTFVGDAGLRVLDWLKGTKEERIGVNRASQGLDGDLLQSTTKAAVTGALTAAQARTELIARLLAEGIKDLYRGIDRLLRKHQDAPMVARLRGKFISVDPSSWGEDMDCTINVGLGQGVPEDRIALLQSIKTTQENLLAQAPSNPIVGFPEYRNTCAKIVELAGYKDASKFFKELPANWQPPAPTNTQPSPEEILAKAQSEQIQAQIKIERAKLDQAEREMYLKDAREREKTALDAKIQLIKIEQEHHTTLGVEKIASIADMHSRASEAHADMLAQMHASETQAAAQPPAEGAAQ